MHRIVTMGEIPFNIRKAFYNSPEPVTPYDYLWREVAARLILDAIGLTGHHNKPYMHNEAVRSARNWFNLNDVDVNEVFDLAGLEDYTNIIREEVLKVEVEYFITKADEMFGEI
jgi:hypothetical protein